MRPIDRYRQELARQAQEADGYIPPQPGVFRPNLPQLISMALAWRMPDGSTLTQEGVHPGNSHLAPNLILDTCEVQAEAEFRTILTRRTT